MPPATLPAGTYRNITGNQATALGFITAAHLADRMLFYASYPITPASTVLHELARHRNLGIVTFQAEDEIAAIGAAIGAAFGGSLALTGTSGPGLALKSEALGLAVVVELPLVVIDVQRAGPSTGMPTKTEQADLLQAMFGRNGEAPVAIVAPATPGDCFTMALEAFRIAVTYMTPVLYLSDGYLANGSEPWRIPAMDDLPSIPVQFRTDLEGFQPYARDPRTLARPWGIPGTPGLEHRVGGLAKEDVTGNVSYDPKNNERMIRLRAQKIAGIARGIPPLEVQRPDRGGLLVLGWGSTYGAITTACEKLRAQGVAVSNAHVRYLNPFPPNLGTVLQRFEQVLIPELNLGQLRMLIADAYGVIARRLSKLQGKPFLVRVPHPARRAGSDRRQAERRRPEAAGRSAARGPRRQPDPQRCSTLRSPSAPTARWRRSSARRRPPGSPCGRRSRAVTIGARSTRTASCWRCGTLSPATTCRPVSSTPRACSSARQECRAHPCRPQTPPSSKRSPAPWPPSTAPSSALPQRTPTPDERVWQRSLADSQ